jgi:hypothetical protein
MSEEKIEETIQPFEKDICIARTVTMPVLMFKLCKKYGVSVSDATKEGAIMLLMLNESFMDSEESLETVYKNMPSKYKDKVEAFARMINKITTGKDLK